jgi:hypothetical protein
MSAAQSLQLSDIPSLLAQLQRDRFFGRVSFDLRDGEVTLIRTERTQIVSASRSHQGVNEMASLPTEPIGNLPLSPATSPPPGVRLPPEWRPRSLAEILSRDYVEPRWIIDGLLLEKSALLTSGQPHSGKSLNWLAAAIESVSTRIIWGKFASPNVQRVLYIETEDPDVVVEQRVRELAKGLAIDPKSPPEGFRLICTGPFEIVKMEAELNALIDLHKPDWVVISTLQGLLGDRDWKEQSEMSAVNATFVRLSRRCPLVVITHSTWDKKNKRAAGSITQAANFLTLVHFDKKIAAGVTKTVVCLDCKLGQNEQFDLILETAQVPGRDQPELRRVRYAGEHAPTQAEEIRAYTKGHPNASPREVSQAVGCSYEHARKVMKQPGPSLPIRGADPYEIFDPRPAD